VEKSGCKWIFFFNFTLQNIIKNMASFIGDNQCKVDPKGRISFPTAFKKQSDSKEPDRFVMKKDIFEQCLILFTIEEWEKQVEMIRAKLNPYKQEHNNFLRNYYKDTAEVMLDTTNRLLIPKRMLELAQIQKDVYLIGLDTKIEIWAQEIYDKLEKTSETILAQMAEKILA